ncbi:MAG: hypothetical protein K0Q85_1526 [Caproiciproducens sp.]|jgi:hypothetical protein|nr:hypothetical protein [Caproiciproducens sp.]
MANNNINWLGNPVVDNNASGRQSYRSSAPRSTPSAQDLSPMTTQQQDSYSQQTQDMTSTAPVMPPMSQQGPPPATDREYIPGYLYANIGKVVRAEFIIGNAQYMDKTGRLTEVGVNYFVLQDTFSGLPVMCDLYSVKFVTTLER